MPGQVVIEKHALAIEVVRVNRRGSVIVAAAAVQAFEHQRVAMMMDGVHIHRVPGACLAVDERAFQTGSEEVEQAGKLPVVLVVVIRFIAEIHHALAAPASESGSDAQSHFDSWVAFGVRREQIARSAGLLHILWVKPGDDRLGPRSSHGVHMG